MSDAYDPTEPDETRRGGQYVTKKDFRVIGVVLVILAILAWPVYMYMLGQVRNSGCNKNLRKIASAMSNYITDSDDHLPFAFETTDTETKQINLRQGLAYSWQWQMQRYTGKDWSVYSCPATKEGEDSLTSDGTEVHGSSYGMLNGYSGLAESMIASPDQKILIAETTKNGVHGTFDPLPLFAGGRVLEDDGFTLGFDNDPDRPNVETVLATRLAFPKTSKPALSKQVAELRMQLAGTSDKATVASLKKKIADLNAEIVKGFAHDTDWRHPDGIHFLTVGGGMKAGDATIAQVIQYGGSFGLWDVPQPPHRLSPKPPAP